MSSFGSQMRKRLAELHKAGQDVPRIMVEVAEGATIAAVEKATEKTPPNGGVSISGTGTRSVPVISGVSVRTTLANNMQHASYVNDGHRMEQHFVPGLIINGNMLEKVNPSMGGITVGTRTKYVEGKYMKEAAIGKYRDVVRMELGKRVREAFK